MRSKPKIKKGRAGAARGFIPKLLVIAAGAALVAGVPFAAGAAYRYVSKLPMFEIRQVKVTGLDFVRKEDFVRYIGDPRGLSFLRYSISDAQKKADEHPWVKSSIVRREAPDTVRFEVVERIPAAVVNTAAGRYVIDSDGYVVAKINDPAWDFLPVIQYPSAQGMKLLGEKSVGPMKEALELVRAVRSEPSEGLAGSAVSVAEDGNPCLLLGGAVVKVGRDGYGEKIKRLTEVSADIRKKGWKPALIDLRFPGKVVVRQARAS